MGFEKICNGCIYYAVQYEFCSMKYIRIGKNVVHYCKDYRPKKRGAAR